MSPPFVSFGRFSGEATLCGEAIFFFFVFLSRSLLVNSRSHLYSCAVLERERGGYMSVGWELRWREEIE